MSSLGIGFAFEAAFAIIGGAAYLSGKILVGGTKLMVRAGKAAYDAHKRHEEERHERIREELSRVEGDLGKAALRRHEEMVRLESEASKRAEKAREEILKRSAEAEKRVAAAERNPEEGIAALEEYLKASEASTEALRKAEEETFAVALAEDCRTIEKAISDSIAAERRTLEAKLDAIEKSEEAQQKLHEDYARRALAEGRALLRGLEAKYDCGTLAGATYEMAKSYVEDIEASVRNGDWKNASMVASMFTESVQMLHLELERNAALFAEAKMNLSCRADMLEAVVAQSHDLSSDGKLAALEEYVDEECDAAFWSEGRLPELWAQAKATIDQLRAFDYSQMERASLARRKADELLERLQAEYFRTCRHVLSRAAMDELLLHSDESMAETGWIRVSEPEYGHIDASGKYAVTDDPRHNLMVRYENEKGDVRVLVVCNEYDPATGRYLQHIEIHRNETGVPDEAQRERDDEAFNTALEKRGMPAEAGVHCDGTTVGMKADV